MSNTKKTIRVAVVDDNAQLRYIAVNQLENSGCIVQFQVSDGQKAIQKIKEDGTLPDVCIIEENFEAPKALLASYP